MAEDQNKPIYPKWWFDIHDLKKEWDGLKPLSKENDNKLHQKFRLEWNYNSNHIEGNTLTYGETELLLIFDKTIGTHEGREIEEMKAHDMAIKTIEEWAIDKSRELTETDIKNLNRIILVRPFWKEAITSDGKQTKREIKVGDYKEFPNSVRLNNGEIFEFASPQETPIKMGELMKWVKEQIAAPLHPLILAAQFHYKFIRIHPFDDGNGRIARLLVNYFLLRSGYPPIIVKSSDKKNYLTALQRADVGDLDAFEEYMANQLIWSLNLSIKAAKGESIDESDDLDKKLSLLENELSSIRTDDEIKVVFDRISVFLKIFDSWLSDLLKKSIVVAQKFNKFYTTPEHFILVQSRNNSVSEAIRFIDDKPEDVIGQLREKLDNNTKSAFLIGEVTIVFQLIYGVFKKSAAKPFGCKCQMTIFFEYTSYKLMVDRITENGSNKQVVLIEKRLLDKPISVKEIDEIAKGLGDDLFQHIEFFSKELRK